MAKAFTGSKAKIDGFFKQQLMYEHHHVKICLQDFEAVPTESGLYSHRRWLEARNFELSKMRDWNIYMYGRQRC